MAISYMPLEITLIKRNLNREALIRNGVISRPVAAKFRKGGYVSLEIIDRLCEYLECRVEDIIEWVPNKEAES